LKQAHACASAFDARRYWGAPSKPEETFVQVHAQSVSWRAVAVPTPFKEDSSTSAGRFIRHCRAPLNDDVGLAVFGANSVANSLSVAEKRRLLGALLEAGISAARMMPGQGACALPTTDDSAQSGTRRCGRAAPSDGKTSLAALGS
jgi:hypothetical protein